MNVLILANRDLASNYALNQLLPRLQRHRLHLMLSSAVGGGKAKALPLEQLTFFEQNLFNDIVFPLLDKGLPSQMKSFSGLSSMLEAPPAIENRINSAESIARVKAIAPDLIISIRYGGILRDEIIALPSQGVINLHSGRLPEYRGVMASFWAMLAGDQELGTSLHFIADASIDTGGVINRTRCPLTPGKSYLWQLLNLYPAAIEQLVAAVDTIALGGSLETTPQSSNGCYYTFPGAEDICRFHDAGHRLFDPSELVEIVQAFYLQ